MQVRILVQTILVSMYVTMKQSRECIIYRNVNCSIDGVARIMQQTKKSQ